MISQVFYMFLILTYIESSLSLQVSLENGATGNFKKDINSGGTDVQLICQPDGEGSLSWSYKTSESSGTATPIVINNQVTSDQSGMFSLSGTYNLVIKSVSPDKSGIYTCQVTPTSGNIGIGSYEVTVLVPPSVPICGFPGDHAITVGHSAKFTCSSQGMPDPTYEWFKDSNKLAESSPNSVSNVTYDPQTGVLSFKNVVPADAGSYYCVATNRAGNNRCSPVAISTKDQDVAAIVGIVFGCVFGVLLIAVLIFWTCKKGYCDGFISKKDDDDIDDDDANDVMLDSTGPTVNKPSSVVNGVTDKHEASMMI